MNGQEGLYLTVVALPTYKLDCGPEEQRLQAKEYCAAKSVGCCAVKSFVQGSSLLSGFSETHFFAEHYGPQDASDSSSTVVEEEWAESSFPFL